MNSSRDPQPMGGLACIQAHLEVAQEKEKQQELALAQKEAARTEKQARLAQANLSYQQAIEAYKALQNSLGDTVNAFSLPQLQNEQDEEKLKAATKLLNNLTQLGRVSCVKEENDLTKAGVEAWINGVKLAQHIFHQYKRHRYKSHEINIVAGAFASAVAIVLDPNNQGTRKTLLKEAEEIRNCMEGSFFEREENKIVNRLLASLLLVVAAATIIGGTLLLCTIPITAPAALGLIIGGALLIGLLSTASFSLGTVLLAVTSAKNDGEELSKKAAASLVNLAKTKNSFFKQPTWSTQVGAPKENSLAMAST